MSDVGSMPPPAQPPPAQPPPAQPPKRKRAWRLVVAAVVVAALAVPAVALLLRADPERRDPATPRESRDEELTFVHPTSSDSLPIEPDSSGALFLQWDPSGTELAYVKGADIWVLGEDGESRNLTETPQRVESFPSWSPDGTQLAFASRRLLEGEEPQGLTGPAGELTLVSEDGSGYQVVGEGPMLWPPSWSREGRRIAYARGDTLEVLDPRTDDRRSFTSGDLGLDDAAFVAGPVWSPKHDEVALYFSESSQEPSREELLAGTAPAVRQGFAIVTPGTRGATVVFEYRAPFLPATPVQWSPDGKTLLINLASSPVSGNPVGLWLADPDGTKAERVERVAAYQAVWSPSGNRIAYIDLDERRILLIDSGSLEGVAEPGPERGVEGIAWRPEGDGE
ncbi:MAG: TolB family protein [Actinomycetota bacterium]